MDDLQFKTLDIEVDKAHPGQVKSQVGVIGGDAADKDGDYSVPGFLGDQGVKMFWNHGLPFQNGLTIGKGRIFEDGKSIVFDGKFNLKMETGKEVYEQVLFDLEEGDPLQEWSYGYFVQPGGASTPTKSAPQGTKRILQPQGNGTPGVLVKEVSPVSLGGAGIETRTLDVKSFEGLTFADQADLTVASVKALIERTVSLAELRRSEGKDIPEQKLNILDQIRELAENATDELTVVTDFDSITVEYNRFLRLESKLNGAPII